MACFQDSCLYSIQFVLFHLSKLHLQTRSDEFVNRSCHQVVLFEFALKVEILCVYISFLVNVVYGR